MLKGVNKLIVEINNPESDYFERAIFFVKPSKGDVPTIKLADNASSLIKNAALNAKPPKKKHLPALLGLLGAGCIGAAIAAAVLIFIL